MIDNISNNHKKAVCQAKYNIDNFPGTKFWNTECAEEQFSTFSKFKSLFNHTTKEHSSIWAVGIFHEQNLRNEVLMNNSKGETSVRKQSNPEFNKSIEDLFKVLSLK